MSDALPPVITQFGVGGIGGFLVGYAVKKIVKIVAFLLGLSVLLLFYLDSIEVITVNYERLSAAASGLLRAAAEFLPVIIGYLPLATSFTAGLTLGLMKG